MSAVTQRCYREAHVIAFLNVLERWLAELPADGWQGSVAELGEALWTITAATEYRRTSRPAPAWAAPSPPSKRVPCLHIPSWLRRRGDKPVDS